MVVRVCGPHHRAAPGGRRFDAKLAKSVVNVWTTAFTAAGAADLRIVADCDEGAVAP